MKRSYVLVFALAFVVSIGAQGARKMKLIRGGQGFLYPDHNSPNNPGQLSRDDGTSMEAIYTRRESSGVTTQSLSPSLAYSNGRLGILLKGTRSGTSFDSDNSTDDIGGALGFSLGRKRAVNIGASYFTTLGSTPGGGTPVGNIEGTINLNPSRGSGVSLGVGVGTTTGGTTNPIGAQVGLGYAGRNRNNNIEANLKFNDINATDNYILSGFFTLGGGSYYFGGGYKHTSTGTTSTGDVVGRLGVVFGRAGSVDLSALATYPVQSGVPTYGASLRANF